MGTFSLNFFTGIGFTAEQVGYELLWVRVGGNNNGMGDVRMDCRVNVDEMIPGGTPLAPGAQPQPPFVLSTLFTAFIGGSIIADLAAAATAIGVTLVPNLNINLFTSVVKVIDVTVPPVLVSVKTSTLVSNFAKITSPAGFLTAGPIKFGVDTTQIAQLVTTFSQSFFGG